jgi:tRNA pseudouridine55 synthase
MKLKNTIIHDEQCPLKKRKGHDIQGWLILNKEQGMTSAHAVAIAKRLFNARKAGHAGTLDPLADGVLPIAFGGYTKTISSVVDAQKSYAFTVSWGIQTDTDDSEGTPIAHSEKRPSKADIISIMDDFKGTIEQVPPVFSALKINGKRAYARARQGESVTLAPRPVTLYSFTLIEHTSDHTFFEITCSKGTYVRSIARDLGQKLGCFGHISGLSRLSVGAFHRDQAFTLSQLRDLQNISPDHLLGSLKKHPEFKPEKG